MAEIIKWWKNKNAVLIICTGVLSVVIAFLFAYFISWGWILSLVIAIAGGITMRIFINKLIDEFAAKNENVKKTT